MNQLALIFGGDMSSLSTMLAPAALGTAATWLLTTIGEALLIIFGVERTLAYMEERKKRPGRERFVLSVLHRLNEIALDWSRVLGSLADARTLDLLRHAQKAIDQFNARLADTAARLAGVSRADRGATSFAEAPAPEHDPMAQPSGRHAAHQLLVIIGNIVNRLRDVLNTIDGNGLLMTGEMLDQLSVLREAVARNLHDITNLKNVLENPTKDQAVEVLSSVTTASLSARTYADVLVKLWEAIPGTPTTPLVDCSSLRALKPDHEQVNTVSGYVYALFPEFSPAAVRKNPNAD